MNLEKIWKKLTTPKSIDEYTAIRESIVRKAIVVIVVLALLFFIITTVIFGENEISAFSNFSIAVLLSMGVLFAIVQAGFWKFAAYIIPTFFALLSLAALYVFGTGDTVVMEYSLAVISAAVFLGKVETIIISAIISISAMAISAIRSINHPEINISFEIVANTIFFSIIAFLLSMLTNHFQKGLKDNKDLMKRTESELKEKIRAEKELRRKNEELEIIIKATVNREQKMIELKKALELAKES